MIIVRVAMIGVVAVLGLDGAVQARQVPISMASPLRDMAGPCNIKMKLRAAALSCGAIDRDLGPATAARSSYNKDTQRYLVVVDDGPRRRLLLVKNGSGAEKPETRDITTRFSSEGTLPANAHVDLGGYASQGIIRVWRSGRPW